MSLTQQDLTAISGLISQQLKPIQAGIHQIKADISVLKTDISSLKVDISALKMDISALKVDTAAMKGDLNLLARLNQLDDIRKEPRLRALYSTTDDHDQKEA